ncbi:hypothetical protein QBC34DRAFT_113429 [Podospora aff. communis PSN243]|uniref:Uncharacterized protein n=1 Tax=Podospora aff. communis PSN243 TaxID=3040156 RepID=A0AAV9GKF7_9PEZI|nr:hypothetical protein QBC34DRAFT_113429 [Podospora aff. communis PSN243]
MRISPERVGQLSRHTFLSAVLWDLPPQLPILPHSGLWHARSCWERLPEANGLTSAFASGIGPYASPTRYGCLPARGSPMERPRPKTLWPPRRSTVARHLGTQCYHPNGSIQLWCRGAAWGGPVKQNLDQKEFLHAVRRSLLTSEPGNSCLGRCTVRTDEHVSMQTVQFGADSYWSPSFKPTSGRVGAPIGQWQERAMISTHTVYKKCHPKASSR